jgi:hypothetical protein
LDGVSTVANGRDLARYSTCGTKGSNPASSRDWGNESHSLAATVRLVGYPLLLHTIINAYWEALEFEIPALEEAQESWR